MPLKSSDLSRLRLQFLNNLRATARLRAKLEAIEKDNASMMKLISEVEPEEDMDQIMAKRAVQRRNNLIKYK